MDRAATGCTYNTHAHAHQTYMFRYNAINGNRRTLSFQHKHNHKTQSRKIKNSKKIQHESNRTYYNIYSVSSWAVKCE